MKINKILPVVAILFMACYGSIGQVAFNADGSPPDPSAMLDVKSNSRGFLAPALTQEQIENIAGPADGLFVFCSDKNTIYVYSENINRWKELDFGTAEIIPAKGNTFKNQNDNSGARILISADNSSAHHSAMLEVRSQDKGVLVSRLTHDEIRAIGNPADGLLVFALTDHKFYVFQNSANLWKELAYGPGIIIPGGSTCGGPLIDSRDGKIYATVQIGDQCWMAQNLNIGSMVYNTVYPTNNGVIEKWCYNVLESNCDIYGGQYYWPELMNYLTTPSVQGICPDGWHIPSIEEFTMLSDYLGGTSVSGGKMKSTGTVEAGTGLWNAPNAGATNSSGFTALPGGQRNVGGSSQFLGVYASFWSSSQNTSITSRAWGCRMNNTMEMLEIGHYTKTPGYSVRCVKNE